MGVPLSVMSVAVCAALLSLPTTNAWAQSSGSSSRQQSSKPAAKPAAAESTGLKPGEKPMSREELRSCLKRSDELVALRKTLEERQTQSQKERAEIEEEGARLKSERDALQADVNAQTEAFKRRVEALNARIKAHSDMAQDVNEGRRTLRGDQQNQFEAERASLQTAATELNAARDALTRSLEERNRAFNAKAAARDARVNDWNQSNGKVVQELRAMETDADAWRRECGNRPYREDDEKAIREGK